MLPAIVALAALLATPVLHLAHDWTQAKVVASQAHDHDADQESNHHDESSCPVCHALTQLRNVQIQLPATQLVVALSPVTQRSVDEQKPLVAPRLTPASPRAPPALV